MRDRLLGLTFLVLLVLAASYQIHASGVRESAPPFEVSSLHPIQGEGTWTVPGDDRLKVIIKRRGGNGPKGWLIDVVGENEVSRDYFYLLDGPTKSDRSALYFAQLDGRPALVSWQPDLDAIDVFPSPQRIPRQVSFWILADDVIKRCGPYPPSTLKL